MINGLYAIVIMLAVLNIANQMKNDIHVVK
jgi:hypothetical protein